MSQIKPPPPIEEIKKLCPDFDTHWDALAECVRVSVKGQPLDTRAAITSFAMMRSAQLFTMFLINSMVPFFTDPDSEKKAKTHTELVLEQFGKEARQSVLNARTEILKAYKAHQDSIKQ